MKSCRNCKFNLKSKFRIEGDMCGHRDHKYYLCSKERRLGDCGLSAKNWEPKNDK